MGPEQYLRRQRTTVQTAIKAACQISGTRRVLAHDPATTSADNREWHERLRGRAPVPDSLVAMRRSVRAIAQGLEQLYFDDPGEE